MHIAANTLIGVSDNKKGHEKGEIWGSEFWLFIMRSEMWSEMAIINGEEIIKIL